MNVASAEEEEAKEAAPSAADDAAGVGHRPDDDDDDDDEGSRSPPRLVKSVSTTAKDDDVETATSSLSSGSAAAAAPPPAFGIDPATGSSSSSAAAAAAAAAKKSAASFADERRRNRRRRRGDDCLCRAGSDLYDVAEEVLSSLSILRSTRNREEEEEDDDDDEQGEDGNDDALASSGPSPPWSLSAPPPPLTPRRKTVKSNNGSYEAVPTSSPFSSADKKSCMLGGGASCAAPAAAAAPDSQNLLRRRSDLRSRPCGVDFDESEMDVLLRLHRLHSRRHRDDPPSSDRGGREDDDDDDRCDGIGGGEEASVSSKRSTFLRDVAESASRALEEEHDRYLPTSSPSSSLGSESNLHALLRRMRLAARVEQKVASHLLMVERCEATLLPDGFGEVLAGTLGRDLSDYDVAGERRFLDVMGVWLGRRRTAGGAGGSVTDVVFDCCRAVRARRDRAELDDAPENRDETEAFKRRMLQRGSTRSVVAAAAEDASIAESQGGGEVPNENDDDDDAADASDLVDLCYRLAVASAALRRNLADADDGGSHATRNAAESATPSTTAAKSTDWKLGSTEPLASSLLSYVREREAEREEMERRVTTLRLQCRQPHEVVADAAAAATVVVVPAGPRPASDAENDRRRIPAATATTSGLVSRGAFARWHRTTFPHMSESFVSFMNDVVFPDLYSLEEEEREEGEDGEGGEDRRWRQESGIRDSGRRNGIETKGATNRFPELEQPPRGRSAFFQDEEEDEGIDDNGAETAKFVASPLLFAFTSVSTKKFGGKWHRLYSSNDDDFTFRRLLDAILGYSGPTVLVIAGTVASDDGFGIRSSGTFGAYASSPWKKSKSFYGDDGCFLFRLTPSVKIMRPRKRNGGGRGGGNNGGGGGGGGRNFMYCNPPPPAPGGGGGPPSTTPPPSSSSRRATKRAAHGLGFGGTERAPRLFLSDALEGRCRAGSVDSTYEPGELLLLPPSSPSSSTARSSPPPRGGRSEEDKSVRFDVDALEVWAVGGDEAVRVGLADRSGRRECVESNLNRARRVNRSKFLDDFMSGTVESRAFAHRDQVRGREVGGVGEGGRRRDDEEGDI